MAKNHIIVGRDAPTEAKARALAKELFGADNVIRGKRIYHRRGCPVLDESIIGVTDCDCPRATVFSNARKLIKR
jgi:hypothetical protein